MRKLIFMSNDLKGGSHFQLDGVGEIVSKSPKLFGLDTLVPLVESKPLADLRRQYEGKPLWSYASHTLWCDHPGGRIEGSTGTSPLVPIKVNPLYQLARQQVKFRSGTEGWQNFSMSGELDPAYNGSAMFVFIVSAPGWKLGSVTNEATMLQRRESAFGPTYFLISETWSLPQRFSLTPPPDWAKRAIRRRRNGGQLKGLSHWEVAWVFGWPGERKPLAEMLKAEIWDFEYFYEIRFKNDRVVSVYQHLPH
ncbi:MAG: hypothetical protein ABL962_01480 [Fimbriimonadaceae bacterium]